MTSALERIELIARVKDNWDGRGAPAFSGLVTMNAKKFVSILDGKGVSIKGEDVRPTTYGNILIDIHKNNNTITIDIGKDNIKWSTEINNQPVKEYSGPEKGFHTDFSSIPPKLNEALQHLDTQRN